MELEKKEISRTTTTTTIDHYDHCAIVIVGGGICGLATALALHRKGISSMVLEKSKTLRATGAAIVMRQNGWRALDHLGVSSKLRLTAIPLKSCQLVSLDDGKLSEFPLGEEDFRILRRTDLIQTLAENLPPNTIHFGSKVISITMDPISSFPILQLQDGTFLNPKVVIGCDGVNSCIAKIVGLNSTRVFSISGVRGFTNYENGHDLGNQFLLMSKDTDHLHFGQFPVTDKLVYWYLTRKSTSKDSTVCKNPLLIKQSTMESMKGFPQQYRELIEKSEVSSLHFTDLRYRAPWNLLRNNFRRGTVTVAGDAMHAMGPFIAQGGSASLEDAVVLARCLAEKMYYIDPTRGSVSHVIGEIGQKKAKAMVESALEQYVKERKKRIVWLCIETFLHGTIRETSSMAVKFIAILFMAVLFRDLNACTNYDCGRL